MADYIKRTLPHDLRVEKSVLGGMLLDEKAIYKVMLLVEPSDFYYMGHAHIFKAMTDLTNQREPVDIITLQDELKKHGKLDSVGGLAFITSLIDETPTAANIQHYARIIKEKSIARQTITLCRAAIEDLYSLKSGEDKIRSSLCAELIRTANHKKEAKHIKDVLAEEIKEIEKRIKTGPGYPGFNTGFTQLNLTIGGIQRKQLIIVGARPSVGKTAFAVNMIKDLAKEAKVLFFSNDQSGGELIRRLLSRYGGIVNTRIRDARIGTNDFNQILNVVGKDLAELPIWINDSRGLTIEDIEAQINYFRQKEGIDVVIIDYLQLISRPGQNENTEIGDITGKLKELAGELDIAVVLLSQLNRDPTKRSGGKPQMYDLRGSGSVEQDANVILLLHRDINKPEDKSMEVIIAKHKDGPLGIMHCNYEAKTFLIGALKMEGDFRGEN